MASVREDEGETRRPDEQESGARVARRPYAAPKLVRLGTLAELTQHIGRQGHPDGGRGTMRRS